MHLRDTSPSAVTLILIASPDSGLLSHRAKVLNDAGYYTSSARTPAEALKYAGSMNCALALICYSFANAERRALVQHLRKVSPGTSIVCLEPDLDANQGVFVSRIEKALASIRRNGSRHLTGFA